jgi:selenocysteine-specific elongation factor
MIIATAGHIDHGKTALVRALTGVDSDRLPEEKRRGMSIDLGFAYTQIGGKQVGIVDVPGHEKFVRNMLAGVTAVNCALLVVAADDGPMPQTREHLDILDLLNVERGVIALTKIDRVGPERLAEVRIELEELVASTCFETAPVVPVCALDGRGIDDLTTHLVPTVSEAVSDTASRNFRLAVDRSFSVTGAGLVVTGHVFSGEVAVDDHLIVSPDGTPVRVRGLHANDKGAERAVQGQRCALNLTGAGARHEGVARGRWLVGADGHAPTQRFDATIRVLGAYERALAHWTPVHLHLGTQDVTARVATLEGEEIGCGDRGLVRITTDRPIAAWVGDRFILRDQSARRTLAGGIVLDALPPQRGRAHNERLHYLRQVDVVAPAQALAALGTMRRSGVTVDEFARGWNLTPDVCAGLLEEAQLDVIGSGVSRLAMDRTHWQALSEACVATVRTWHEDHPDRAGIERERLRANLKQRVAPALLDAAIASLRADGDIRVRGHLIGLPNHRARLGHTDKTLFDRVLPYLETATDKPPTMPDLAKLLELDPAALRAMAERAVGAGLLAHVNGNRFFTLPRLRELAGVAEELAQRQDDEGFSAAQFRDASGIGRNVTIELLEYFDRIALTRRLGNVRKLRNSAAHVADQHWGT